MAFETNGGAALTGSYIGVRIIMMFSKSVYGYVCNCLHLQYSIYVAPRMYALSTLLNLIRRVRICTYFSAYLEVFFLV
jgi:hypothetical protein